MTIESLAVLIGLTMQGVKYAIPGIRNLWAHLLTAVLGPLLALSLWAIGVGGVHDLKDVGWTGIGAGVLASFGYNTYRLVARSVGKPDPEQLTGGTA